MEEVDVMVTNHQARRHTIILKELFEALNFQIFIFANLLIEFVEDNGFEPLTPCVQGRCSSQLS